MKSIRKHVKIGHEEDIYDAVADYRKNHPESEDQPDIENNFIEKLIEELPQYGIDTSKWEYDFGDCCDNAVEFMARVLKSYPEIADNKTAIDLLKRAYQLHPLREGQNILEAGMTFEDSCKLFEEIKTFINNNNN